MRVIEVNIPQGMGGGGGGGGIGGFLQVRLKQQKGAGRSW